MTKIEFTERVVFGEDEIDEITVLPLNYVTFESIWRQTAAEVQGKDLSSNAVMQRKRIAIQAQFMSSGKRIAPTAAHISQLPIPVARKIIASLDIGEGVAGKLLNDADGIASPVHYQLGTPLTMLSNGKKVEISELEFQAQIFGDIEDVLATDGDVPQALALLRKVATPLGDGVTLKTLPTWALDRITLADGVTVMREVMPRFLG